MRPSGLMIVSLCLAALQALAVGGDPALRAEEPAVAPLLPIADVKSLPEEAFASEGPVGGKAVRVRGVITWKACGVDSEDFSLQDATGGIWATMGFARLTGLVGPGSPGLLDGVEPGTEVEVEGVAIRHGPSTGDNLYSVMIMPRAVTVVGPGPLPAPRPVDHTFLFSGAADHLRVAVRGIVQGFRAGEDHWLLFLDAEPGEVGALVPKRAFHPDPSALVDAEVRISGVCGACYNHRGDFVSPRIHLNSADDLVVEKTAAGDPFESPRVAIDGLAAYRFRPYGPHRMRVEGVVTYVHPGECFYIQDGAIGVRVETRSDAPLHVGDRVEVAGFLSMERRIAGLKEAVVRPISVGSPPQPVAMDFGEIFGSEDAADGRLVTVGARLLEARKTLDGCQLVLAAGDSGINATLHGPEPRRLLALRPGSELSLTGIVDMDLHYDYRIRPQVRRIGLLLRSEDDVAVVREPSWWTRGRLLRALAAVSAVLLAAMGWGLLLRRQVAAKSRQLAREMSRRRDAAVEFEATLRERNRLAANLHDTLLQTLGGIGYQLEACERSGAGGPDETKRHFEVAQRMVEHAMGQMHDSVWTLRSLPLRNQTFPEALRAMAARIGEGHDVRIVVDARGSLADVPEFVGGNLLLMIQEAVHNAIRHGRPNLVTIVVRRDETAGMIRVSVADDGRGFVPGSQRGMEAGHFGIEGMRERAERLGGTLDIESRPGRGTTVHASVSCHAYDRELA